MFEIGDTIKTEGVRDDIGKLVCCLVVDVLIPTCVVSKKGKFYAVKLLQDVKSSRMILIEKTAKWFVPGPLLILEMNV